jgi:hypothetical protein
MDKYEVTRTWRVELYKTHFRGVEETEYDLFEWRDYFKVVENGRYQVWKNERRTGWNYTPTTIEEMLDKLKKVAAQCQGTPSPV